MAHSNGWIGRSWSSLARAAPRALAGLALGLVAGASPSLARSAPATPAMPPTPPPKIAAPAPKKPPAESAPTRAEEPLPSVLRDRARAAMEADQLAESRAALLALLIIEPTLSTTCNLGLIARRLSLWVEAADNLNRCVRAYAAVPAAGRALARYDEMRAELAMARAMVAAVRIRTPEGARVTIDGMIVGPLTPHRETFLEPGTHVIEVANDRRELDLRAGSTRTLDFAAPPPAKPKKIDPIAAAGGAGIGVFTGVGGGLLALSFIYRGAAEGTLVQIEKTSGGSACREAWRTPGPCLALTKYATAADALLSASVVSFALSGALIAGTAIYTSGKSPPPARVVVGLRGVRVEAAW